MLDFAAGGRVRRRGMAIGSDREPISPRLLTRAPPQHAQIIIVGMVLHHQNQDVVDLRKAVRTFRPGRKGALALDPPSGAARLRSQDTRLPFLIRTSRPKQPKYLFRP
jgi:hypothetical protein